MKLRTKLTIIGAALLILTAAVLTAAMLWLVREQAYQNLTDRAKQQLQELDYAFGEDRSRAYASADTEEARNVMLRYYFQQRSVEGGVLAVNGKLLAAPIQFDPQAYLNVGMMQGIQVRRISVSGRHYLLVGKATEIGDDLFRLFIAADAEPIEQDFVVLISRFALFCLAVCILGLLVMRWVIGKALLPLSSLQTSANRIASGSYGERVPIDSKDEIGMLARDFNRMAASVEEHIQSLQAQNERQKLFIAGVTHEFKTPLTSLLLNVDTLRTVYLPEEKREDLLEAMDGQLNFLEQMVHKLLKLLSMQQSAKLQTLSAADVLTQVNKLAEPIMYKYGTVLEIRSAEGELPMDADLLCSAIVNLIENSAKASQPGQKIALSFRDNAFTVEDQGCGIAEQDLDKITDPFYMGDPSRSKAKGGYGLGLALVKEIASVHGARLEIKSKPGMGTTVSIIFPANRNQTVMQP